MTVTSSSSNSLTELKSLVSTTLEHAGILARIRAQLRHHVFLAVNDQPQSSNACKTVNNSTKLASQLNGDDRLLIDLINDYLSSNYEFSSMTFRAETGLKDVVASDKLFDKCGLPSYAKQSSSSLLLDLVRRGLQSYRSGDNQYVKTQPIEETKELSFRDDIEIEAESEPHSPVVQKQYTSQPSNNQSLSSLSSLPAFTSAQSNVAVGQQKSKGKLWDQSEDQSSDESEHDTSKKFQSTKTINDLPSSHSNSQSDDEPEVEVEIDEEFYESSPISHSPISSNSNSFNKTSSAFATTQPSETFAKSASATPSSVNAVSTNTSKPESPIQTPAQTKPSSSLSSLSSLPSLSSGSLGKTSLLGSLPSLGSKPPAAVGGFSRPIFDDTEVDIDEEHNDDNSTDNYADDHTDADNTGAAEEEELDSDEEKLREIDRNIAALEAKQREQASKYLSSTSSTDNYSSAGSSLSKTAPMTAAPVTSTGLGSTISAGTKSPPADDYADEFGDADAEIEEDIEEEIEEEVEIEISGDEEF